MHYANLKTSLRAAKDKQWGRMRPAGRQFDMPDLEPIRRIYIFGSN
jgi:hypothetical protein